MESSSRSFDLEGFRGWRERAALDSLHKEGLLNSVLQDGLAPFIPPLCSLPQPVVREELLRTLSSLFLCGAPTSSRLFNCPNEFTIKISLGGGNHLNIKLEELIRLHGILFSDLEKYSKTLFQYLESSELQDDEDNKLETSNSQMEVIKLTLRCCLRILPFLEFDTNLTHIATESLVKLHLKCRSHTNLDRLSTTEPQEKLQHLNAGRTKCYSSLHSLWNWAEKVLFKDLASREPFQGYALMLSSVSEVYKNDHNSKSGFFCAVVCGLIEVFIDELLLNSRLEKDFAQSESYTTQTHMIMDLVEAHLLFSLYDTFEDEQYLKVHCSALSLPAVIRLLDISRATICGPFFPKAHLLRLVSRVVWEVQARPRLEALPKRMLVYLASFALETSVKLYAATPWGTNNNNNNGFLDPHSGLLEAALHLISTSLCRVLKETGSTTDEEFVLHLGSINEVFKLLQDDSETMPHQALLQKLLQNVGDGVRRSFVFFGTGLALALQNHVPQGVCKAYLCVLASLLHYALVMERRNTQPLAQSMEAFKDAQDKFMVEEKKCCMYVDALKEFLHSIHPDKVLDLPIHETMDGNGNETHEKVLPNESLCQQSKSVARAILLKYKYIQHQAFVQKEKPKCRRNSEAESEVLLSESSITEKPERSSIATRSCPNGRRSRGGSNNDQKGNSLRNAYIGFLLKQVNGPTDDFSDLTDWIVCKKGRNYGEWINLRKKKRWKQRVKINLKRSHDKRKLVALLCRHSGMI